VVLRGERISNDPDLLDNLQVWYENHYDTRLLHRNLAFALLKKLADVGDPLAKDVIKNEIAKRIDAGNINVIKYLILERYIDLLEFEELEAFIDFQPLLDSFNALLEEEFARKYVKALQEYGMKFRFLQKNEKAFPVASSLERIRGKASDLLKKLLENIITRTSYNSLLYLHIEGFFHHLDFQNFSDILNSHIINELHKGIKKGSSKIFNLSFYMLVFYSYGTLEEREEGIIHRFQLHDNLHLSENLTPKQRTSLINIIAKRIIFYFDFEEFPFNFDAICDFFSSFGENAMKSLYYILRNSSGALRSIAQKCIMQIKAENPKIGFGIQPEFDINIDTLLKLSSNEIKVAIPLHTGKILMEKLLPRFFTMPQGRSKGDYYEELFSFFEKIGKEGKVLFGEGLMNLLTRRDLELTELMIELRILEFLTTEEALLIIQNPNFLRDFLKVLENQEEYEGKSEFMKRLSKFFESLKTRIDKPLENKIRDVFKEFPPTFQNGVIKLHFITSPTNEDLIDLFQSKISDPDTFDYFFVDPFFTNLGSQKKIIEKFLLGLFKDPKKEVLEGILDSGFLFYFKRKDFIALNVDFLENFIPLVKKIFNIREDAEEELSEYEYDYDWDSHEKIRNLERLFNEIKEIRSFITLPKEKFKNNMQLLNSLIKKRYITYLSRNQFWNFFPEEAKYLRQIEKYLGRDKVFEFHPNYRLDSPRDTKSLGFSVKDSKVYFVSLGHSKLQNNEIEESLAILTNIDSIERLELNHNQFTDLPDIISNFKHLKYLILTYTGLTSVPESIGNISKLIYLALNYNNLTVLPDTIGNWRTLESLYLNNNSQLKSLPESIGKLENLNHLYLRHTGLKSLPKSFYRLKSLQALRIEECQITTLPETIDKMPSLSSLHLSESSIKLLPDSIGNSKSISYIDISNTQIKTLPESIQNTELLKEIVVSESYLKNLPALRRLMAPLFKKDVTIKFKGGWQSSRFAYFTDRLEGDTPYSKQLY